MQTKKALMFGSIVLVVLAVMATGIVVAVQVKDSQPLSLQSIAEKCMGSIDKDGFGHAKVGAAHIQNETLELSTPCIVELEEGATLQLTKTRIKSANLYITSESDATQPVHIVVKGGQLTSDTGGIYIQLPVTGSSVEVTDSTLTYPLSIGMSVGSGEDDKNATLHVANNIFSSNSKGSEGILLVSTGRAVYRDNRFSIGNREEDVLLVAQQCQSVNNGSAIVHCQ